jgi:hypothetical protein
VSTEHLQVGSICTPDQLSSYRRRYLIFDFALLVSACIDYVHYK